MPTNTLSFEAGRLDAKIHPNNPAVITLDHATSLELVGRSFTASFGCSAPDVETPTYLFTVTAVVSGDDIVATLTKAQTLSLRERAMWWKLTETTGGSEVDLIVGKTIPNVHGSGTANTTASVVLTSTTVQVTALTPGPQGEPGEGVAAGGTTGQALVKASDDDYDTEWITLAGAGLTQEQAEDIVGALIDDNSDLDWTYDDATGSLVAVIKPGAVTNAMLAGSIALSKLATDPLARANHTGSQPSSSISDLTETVQDLVGAMATDGTTVNFTYDDTAGTLTAEVQGLTSASLADFAEAVRDRLGSTLVAGAGITVTVDDPGDTVTITAEVTQAELDAKAALAGASFTGSAPIAVDSVTAANLVTLPNGTVNGYVVKLQGASAGYGRGQAFLVLEEGAGDATDQTSAGSILFRIDEKGSVGTTGGLHVASGLRKAYGGVSAVWIDPSEDTIGLLIHNPGVAESASWTADFVRVIDVRASDATRFAVNAAGQTVHYGGGTVATPGVTFDGDTDTGLVNLAANIIGFVTDGAQRCSITTSALSLANGINIATNTSTGSIIGVTTSQKLGFWGATPIVRPTSVTNLSTLHAALVSAGLISGTFSDPYQPASIFVRKSADESVSSETLQADDHLTVAVAANKTYRVTAPIYYTASTGGDIKILWTAPAGATFDWDSVGSAVVGVASETSALQSGSGIKRALGDTVTYGGVTTGAKINVTGTLITAGTAGNFALTWARNASDATATVVQAGSSITLQAVA